MILLALVALLGFITENRKSSFDDGDIKLANSNDEKCHGCLYRSKFLYYAFCISKTHMTALQKQRLNHNVYLPDCYLVLTFRTVIGILYWCLAKK